MSTIHIRRLHTDDAPTVGLVYLDDPHPFCFSLEDRYRDEKVAGDTRIPEGEYELHWRTTGSWAARFRKWGFPGSLEVKDVPGFSDILLHVGNDHDDTAGCPLFGYGADVVARTIASSRAACRHLYKRVHGDREQWYLRVTRA